jgi:DNA mismatch endonuclease (patch repair protein)
MDTVDKSTRSYIMSRVGQKDTGPEILLRSSLHTAGLRYRLHDRRLPGSPDLVFPRFHTVVFVHGCYWHSHGCYRSTVPKSRQDFWLEKFEANRSRDERNLRLLREGGWRVLTIWECALRGKTAKTCFDVAEAVKTWLVSSDGVGEIAGMPLSAVSWSGCEARP